MAGVLSLFSGSDSRRKIAQDFGTKLGDLWSVIAAPEGLAALLPILQGPHGNAKQRRFLNNQHIYI
ncbi:hypothetical protein [Methylocystis sp. H62]|uniref:hypothetical protein n=1 Tax=Methylocystis sp. H62 TaxID=2785789 RepID=UPI001AEEEBBA|nr:hypothetical protein [Methylocystis sp. H62]